MSLVFDRSTVPSLVAVEPSSLLVRRIGVTVIDDEMYVLFLVNRPGMSGDSVLRAYATIETDALDHEVGRNCSVQTCAALVADTLESQVITHVGNRWVDRQPSYGQIG